MLSLLIEILATFMMVIKEIVMSIFFTFISPLEKSVEGEIVLITGAGSGIGRLMCLEFAKRGAVIIAWDINERGNQETASLVRENHGTIYTYKCDVSDYNEVCEVASQVKKDVGDVTVLINNAGITNGKSFLQCSKTDLMKIMAVNVHAHFWTLKSFLPAMMRHNHGHIVTIASWAGLIGAPGLTDYSASKFANVGFTESLALELMKENRDGIHTTTVCPYVIYTGMFKGFTSRFERLLTGLSPEYAASKIVTAVLTNQRLLIMPRIGYLLVAIKALLPVAVTERLIKFAGGLNCMDEFIGHQ